MAHFKQFKATNKPYRTYKSSQQYKPYNFLKKPKPPIRLSFMQMRNSLKNTKNRNKNSNIKKEFLRTIRAPILKGLLNKISVSDFFFTWQKKNNRHLKVLQWVNYIIKLKKKGKLSRIKNKITKIIVSTLLRNLSVDKNWLTKYTDKYKKKEKKDPRLILERKQFANSWERKKWSVLRFTPLPIIKKTRQRFKFYKPLRWIIRYPYLPLWSNTLALAIYNTIPKKILPKKKILIKKMLYYYYKLPFRKPISNLIAYSHKFKNKLHIKGVKNLVNILESKLCIFLVRLRYASNVWESCSKITKGNFLVNGKIIYEPGYILRLGDLVQWKNFFEYYISCLVKYSPKRLSKCKFFWKHKIRSRLGQLFFNKYKRIFANFAFIKEIFWKAFIKRMYTYKLKSLNTVNRFLLRLLKKKKKELNLKTKLLIYKFNRLLFLRRSFLVRYVKRVS